MHVQFEWREPSFHTKGAYYSKLSWRILQFNFSSKEGTEPTRNQPIQREPKGTSLRATQFMRDKTKLWTSKTSVSSFVWSCAATTLWQKNAAVGSEAARHRRRRRLGKPATFLPRLFWFYRAETWYTGDVFWQVESVESIWYHLVPSPSE